MKLIYIGASILVRVRRGILIAGLFAGALASDVSAASSVPRATGGEQATIEREWWGILRQSRSFQAVRLQFRLGEIVPPEAPDSEPIFWISGTMERGPITGLLNLDKWKSIGAVPVAIKGQYRTVSRTFSFAPETQWAQNQANHTVGVLTQGSMILGISHNRSSVTGLATRSNGVNNLIKVIAKTPQAKGTLTVDDKLVTAQANRQASAWAQEMAVALDALQPGPNADRLPRSVYAWSWIVLTRQPTEDRALQLKARETERRTTIGSAEIELAHLEAQPRTEMTLTATGEWLQRYSNTMRIVDIEGQQRLMTRHTALTDKIIAAVLEQHATLAQDSARGLAAVVSGSHRYLKLKERYSIYSQSAGFTGFYLGRRQERDRILTEAKDEMIQAIRTTAKARELRAMLEEWLAVPGDPQSPVGGEVAALGQETVAQLEWTEKLAMYSRREQQWLQRDGTLVIPSDAGPPDADDIEVALLREYALFGGGRGEPRITRYQPPQMKLFKMWFAMSVGDVAVEQIGRMEDGGYAVQFKAKLNIDYTADPWTSAQMREGSFQILAGILDRANVQPAQARVGSFVLTPEGWRSPTEQELMQQGVDQALMMASSLIDSIRRKIFGPRTTLIYP